MSKSIFQKQPAKEYPDGSDEEGTYLSMFGSNSFCGTITLNDIQQAVHYLSGDRLEEAIKKAGLAGRELFHLNRTRYLAYLEAHIEQSPHLEHQVMKIGVVTAIVVLRTFKISFLESRTMQVPLRWNIKKMQ